MKNFVYKAWNDKLEVIKSEIEENDVNSAIDSLKNKGLKIIYIKEKTKISNFFRRKLSDNTLAQFCGQIAMILSSGVSLLNGFEIIQQQTKDRNMSKILEDISKSIKKGNNLNESMKSCEQFPRLLTDMVAIGEISGNIDTILYSMEEFYKKEASIKNKIKNAFLYPIVIFLVAIGMLIFFNIIVFPEIKDMLSDMQLPLITVFMLKIINFFNSQYAYIIGFVVVMIFFIRYMTTVPKLAFLLGKFMLKIPIFGDIKMDIITARFTRSMGIFLKSAVPIVTIMDNVKLIVDNEFVSKKIENARNHIVGGSKFADSIKVEQIFKPIVTEMIKVGEETGQLDEMMFKLTGIYDERVEMGVARIMALVEPVLTIVIGVIVGTVILGMALPVMQMTQGMK
ncbi:type II secretion system F family protein [Clostridium tyrobutyricum]|uniref:type II secretion system F family protein n=1 Tax=Clostridium tyrobutyricum TaxID=1519 RepID=UPI001C38BCC7|nr:type II secretion system F family protein [Clostridium tyrobutyricum]MBV4448394.1 type II secretion system F family protein [Clostridium tyrobutyricum]